VLVSTNGGFNFWVGNNPSATGAAYDARGEPVWTRIPESLKQELEAQSEVQQDQFLYREGLRFIHDEPGRFLALTARRLLYFWWFRPGAGSGQSPYPPYWVLAYQLVYGAVLVAAGVGVWAARAAWRRLWPIYAFFVSLTAVCSVFFVHTRYRMILEPFLLVLAAHGLAVLWGRIRPYCVFRRCRPPIPGMSSSGLERAD
jgi:hypothetical protein